MRRVGSRDEPLAGILTTQLQSDRDQISAWALTLDLSLSLHANVGSLQLPNSMKPRESKSLILDYTWLVSDTGRGRVGT